MTLLPQDDTGERIQALRPGVARSVAIGATSQTAPSFSSGCKVVRFVATSPCFLALGAAPTATTADHYLPTDVTEYFRVNPGEAVAVIRVAADGVLYLSEMV